jgi:hypothetical protein
MTVFIQEAYISFDSINYLVIISYPDPLLEARNVNRLEKNFLFPKAVSVLIQQVPLVASDKGPSSMKWMDVVS